MFNMGGFDANSREAHAAEIGSANGMSNARGLAGLYAPIANGGALNGVKLGRTRHAPAHGAVLGRDA